MKKILPILLIAILSLSICACGNEETATDQEPAAEEPAEIVIVDNETCTFKITEASVDETWGYILKVYVENKTDQNLNISWDNAVVNGFLCDPCWGMELPAGAKSNEEIIFYNESLAENGINPADVNSIDFTLMVHDSDDWEADFIINEQFSITTDTLK